MRTTLPPPYLIADNTGVELLNSMGAPYGEELDWLRNGTEMLCWMQSVGLLTAQEAEAVRNTLEAQELEAAASDLRDLRAAFCDNVPVASAEFLDRLNACLAETSRHDRIVVTQEGVPELQQVPRLRNGRDLVGLCAAAIADLLCQGEPGRTRQCDGPTCTYWFRDTSKNNRRRWCSMAVCGNRAKVASHRARAKSD
ncbi:CGNR zinc finger domain-containing protein [Ruegeria sp. 1NDH52C]|uniref:CGNR zinc finger domain-containing protein n=1 Tax=Ruegeria alba TaxID=2916756 RepID=A0ABS9NTH7_9RHOB|nr:CGNR zinc finger domain-containing protein [Ruegeria alba]MCG6557479.1 CGNR zinc finger domain-containing protein [Ruegeria alba]